MIWFKNYQHLLPRARAWSLTANKTLRDFFTGLSQFPQDYQDFDDDVVLDFLPQHTRFLDEWEEQFGLTPDALTDQERRDRLEATWAATGGQSPRYLQDTMQAAGFNVFIHEWWDPGSLPAAVARDPNAADFVLVNKIRQTKLNIISLADRPIMHAGKPGANSGYFDSLVIDNVVYTIPDDSTKWPYFLYFGGAIFGGNADVPASRQEEFERLLLKICPAQQWLALFVTYV